MTSTGNEKIDYSTITEGPGLAATGEQLERLYHRYHLALQFAEGKDVLEVACGAGMGLGYLAGAAHKVVAGDIDEKNVLRAKEHYRDRQNIEIGLMDAHQIGYPDQSFDLVLLYEAIYYLKEPPRFVSEADRLLKDKGTLIICTVNKDWEDFHPSDYTFQYFSVPELAGLLRERFKEITVYGAFPIEKKGLKNRVLSLIKRAAVKFDLIPGSLKARAYLKRIFLGKLTPLPEEVYDGMSPYQEAVPITADRIDQDYKIIYVIAKKTAGSEI